MNVAVGNGVCPGIEYWCGERIDQRSKAKEIGKFRGEIFIEGIRIASHGQCFFVGKRIKEGASLFEGKKYFLIQKSKEPKLGRVCEGMFQEGLPLHINSDSSLSEEEYQLTLAHLTFEWKNKQ